MEDVQMMLKNSKEQSFLFIIDSAMRDHVAYPTPSEYYIPFPMPFKNVFAVDLVDATIPRTEYSIEQNSNTLAYAPGNYMTYQAARKDGALVQVSIAPGDYNVSQLTQTINNSLSVEALRLGHAPLVCKPLSNPVDLTNKLFFARSEPFVMFIGDSSIRKAIGFGNPANTLGGDIDWRGAKRYTTDNLVIHDIFHSVPATLDSELAYAGPVPVEVVEYSVELSQTLRQSFTAEASGLLSGLTLRGFSKAAEATTVQGSVLDMTFDPPALVQTFSVPVTPSASQWTWSSAPQPVLLTVQSVSAAGGQVTLTMSSPHGLAQNTIIVITGATTLVLNGTWVLSSVTSTTVTFTCAAEVPVLGTGTVYASKEILHGRVYAIQINQVPDVSLYKAESFTDTPVTLETLTEAGEWETVSTQDVLSLDIQVNAVGYKVEAPGQCNLTGERYVLVRSPDIEQHLHRDLAAAFDRMAPGLGMLKLGGGTGGYREERLNFLAYATRKFHPIGKLKGLHIRLETRSGRVYNAHGIDHTLLLCVKMYAAGPSQTIPRDLYPGYTPDSQKALIDKLERERNSGC